MTSPSPEDESTDKSVDPALIRFRPGQRHEGDHPIQYCTIHGYRRAFVRCGIGLGRAPHPRHRRQFRHVASRDRSAGPAPHGCRARSARPWAIGQAARRLLGRRLCQWHARSAQRARNRPGHSGRSFPRRGSGGPVRLPISRTVRAVGPRGKWGRREVGEPVPPAGGCSGGRGHDAAVRPAPRTGGGQSWRPTSFAGSPLLWAAMPKNFLRSSTRSPTRLPGGPFCARCVQGWTGGDR